MDFPAGRRGQLGTSKGGYQRTPQYWGPRWQPRDTCAAPEGSQSPVPSLGPYPSWCVGWGVTGGEGKGGGGGKQEGGGSAQSYMHYSKPVGGTSLARKVGIFQNAYLHHKASSLAQKLGRISA